ncbi:MAG TPA: potassium channel family protein [Candidatus Acidoferrales bacterium]|nr:potassium channel family protein [Candidatus Acidoferrales bacterium]
MELVIAAVGVVVVASTLIDIFQTVILPRPIIGSRVGLSRWLVQLTWGVWRWYCLRLGPTPRERRLALYAPSVLILMLAVWIFGLMLGYGLVLYAVRDETHPGLPDVWTAIYFAATSLLTIGFGDVVATSWLARAVAIIAAATGLVVVALTITFVFSLYAFFQRRELLVTTLDERAGGAPPSGVALLETHGTLDMTGDLARVFSDWEVWAAEVLDSHLAYPLLGFFRSSHDNESWVSALGAMLDAATLCETVVEDVARGPAAMVRRAGSHLVEDVTAYFRMPHEHGVGVERDEFDAARERLRAAGYRLRDPERAWIEFSELRANYAGDLNSMARFWAVPPAQWIGDRSPMPHTPA